MLNTNAAVSLYPLAESGGAVPPSRNALAAGGPTLPPPSAAWAFNEAQLQQALLVHFCRAPSRDAEAGMRTVLQFLKSDAAKKLRIGGDGHA
jgi:hypothetical protein